MMFLFLIPLIALVWLAARPGTVDGWSHLPHVHPAPTTFGANPVQILRERLASGEISTEQYESILARLR